MTYTHDQVMAMDADALRLAISKLRGYGVVAGSRKTYHLVFPNGYANFNNSKTEAEAWNDAPDWPGDIAAAWELVDEIIESDERTSVSVQVKKGNIQFCDLTQWNPFHKPGIEGRGDTKEIAICRAWLMWKAGR